MKKCSIAVVTMLIALIGGSVSADVTPSLVVSGNEFVHTMDFHTGFHWWGGYIETADYITIGNHANIEYTHDLNAGPHGLDIPNTHRVTDAALSLTFGDDEGDSHGWFFGYYDYREFVKLAYDGVTWFDITDVSNGQDVDSGTYSTVLAIDWLTDGKLNVQLDIWNPLGNADLRLYSSTLSGHFEDVPADAPHAPVPGAALLGMLGLGVAGTKLRRRS
ncbi:MAG TPA: hypothetical protein PLU87_16935 [Sedimentisphaerales bacterium]|nr:hypothetical protein [Sedimentisphaerales bacterium]HRS12771.1 hypothetical protein [Sedimentisphaerales bacterium]HRV49380.1 hypothetical protein [Sedimentisphaerales bacterium]